MLVEIAALLVVLFLWLYHYVTKQFDFFEKRGVPFAKPSFPFGSINSKLLINQKIGFNEEVRYLLENGFKNEKIFGYFSFGQPIWVINTDEELAKRVFIKDFDHFTDIRSIHTEGTDKTSKIINNMFFNLKGEEWRNMRSIVTNVFSSSKFKMMTPYIIQCAENMENSIGASITKGQVLEAKDLSINCAIDSIATAGFGLENDSFADPDSKFRRMALEFVGHPDYAKNVFLRIVFVLMFPKIAGFFNINFSPAAPVKYFANIVESVYKHRKESGTRRNDIIDILVDEVDAFKKEKKASVAKYESEEELMIMLVANAIIFFLAGIDTISFSMVMVVYQLVNNPEEQDKVHEEVISVLEEDDGKITYDNIQKMTYLDQFINEAMRYQDFINHAERLCTKDYKIPGTDYVIEKGRYVKVYVRDFGYDNNNFINPDKFDPANFDKESNPNKFGSQAFGHGPRSCIGMRFAKLSLKLQTIHLIRKYRLLACEKTSAKLSLDKDSPFSISKYYLKAEARE